MKQTFTVKPIVHAIWLQYGMTKFGPRIRWREIANRWAADEFLNMWVAR